MWEQETHREVTNLRNKIKWRVLISPIRKIWKSKKKLSEGEARKRKGKCCNKSLKSPEGMNSRINNS